MSPDSGTRRLFLQRAGGCLVAGLGLPTDVWALPIRLIEGRTVANERNYPLPAVDGVTIDHAAQVMLARSDGRVYGFAMACPHQHAAVRWLDTEHRFECTKHHSKYQVTGVYTSGRATRNLDRFPIRRDPTTVFVDVSRVFESDKDPAGWAAASAQI